MSRLNLTLRLIWWLCVLSAFDWLAARHRQRPRHNRLLIVKLDAIGDFVLWTDAGQAMRRLYPRDRWHVTLLANRLCAELAREMECFDEVWELDRKTFVTKPGYRYRLLKQVSGAGFAKVIHPTVARDFLWGDAVVRASSAPERIGVSGCFNLMTKVGSWISDRWYTSLLEMGSRGGTALQKNARFVRALGARSFIARLPRLSTHAADEVVQRPYYVIAPGAGHEYRQWPVEKFAGLTRRVYGATGWEGLICGSASEQPLAAAIISLGAISLRDYTGVTTIPELLRVIQRAQLVVANETSAIHIAAAVGTPSVCILGGGHYGQFLPYDVPLRPGTEHPRCVSQPMQCFNCNWVCRYRNRSTKAVPCIANVSDDAVWMEVESIIRRQLHLTENRLKQ
jgi:ADP-heptose:LPS heptosyltransferase